MLVVPLAAKGQCESIPLPYTTDMLTGFQPPSNTQSPFLCPWTAGVNSDNCWTGYLDYGDNDSYDGAPFDHNSARGRFGYILNYNGGTEWMEAEIAVKDSTHNGVAMLIAPRFDSTPAAFRLKVKLQRYVGGNYTGDALYWAHVDVGWVTDAAHPDETFLQTGSFAIQSHHLLDTSWNEYCLPVLGEVPAGGRFALRLRSKTQGPAQNWVPSYFFFYEFMFRRIVADTAVCSPPLSTDTVYVTDSVCQHSPYNGNGIALSASETADTGTRTFVLHDYEYYSPDSCLFHVKVLTLAVLPSNVSAVVDSIFPGEAYTFGGLEMTLAGTYIDDRGVNAYGCPDRDSLVLCIKPLPPMPCGAEIGVERTEFYLEEPTVVHLWSEGEGQRYHWQADSLSDDGTQRDAYVTLMPESQQRVRLEVEHIDTVNHIYRGDAMDTTVTGWLLLTVPVEPQTRYLIEVTANDSVELRVYNQMPDDLSWQDSLLRATFFTSQNSEESLLFHASVPVRLSRFSLRRYCLAGTSVLLIARSVQPVIVAERETICQGDSLLLLGTQTDSCRWDSSPHDPCLDNQQGRDTVTVSPTTITTYYLLSSSGLPVDSLTVQVLPPPRMHIVADRQVVDLGHPVLSLEEQSDEITRSHWTFSDGDTDEGPRVNHLFGLVNIGDSLWVLAEGCNAQGCCADTLLHFEVGNMSAWFPNVFTPDADINRHFGMTASVAVEKYELTVYNRWGLLVYRTNDLAVPWDGNGPDGSPCPQGTYAYVCHYRLAGDYSRQQVGTVLLLR